MPNDEYLKLLEEYISDNLSSAKKKAIGKRLIELSAKLNLQIEADKNKILQLEKEAINITR